MHRKTIIRPVPPGAKSAGPGRVKVRRKNGEWETLQLNAEGKMVDYSKSWYGYIRQANGKSKEVALCPTKASAKLMLAQLSTKARNVALGLEVEEKRDPARDLGPVIKEWLFALESAGLNQGHQRTEQGRINRMVELCGFKVVRDLYSPTAPGAIANALDELKRPDSPVTLPKGEEFSPGQLRAILEVTQSGLAKLAFKRGVKGAGMGKARRFTREEAETLIAHRNLGLSNRTVNGHAITLRAFCAWAYKRQLIPTIPAFPRSLKEKNDRRIVRRALTLEETKTLAEATKSAGAEYMGLSAKLRAGLYLLAFRSLLRARALRELRPGDCHLDDETPWIQVRGQTDKTGKERKIPLLCPETVQALRDRIASTPKGKPLFPIPGEVASIMRKDLRQAGIEVETEDGCVDLHALRHSGATHLARSGVALDAVAKIGGWTNLNQFFDRYGKYTVENLANSIRGAK